MSRFLPARGRIGIIVIGLVVTWAVIVVMRREVEQVVSGTEEIRIAHMVLDPGFREALATLCDEYEALQLAKGNKVKVTPIEIPPNVYTQWARTQLIGKTAPEIMVIYYELTRDPELVARYFRSFSEEIDLPNPYNEGTIHEGVPLRDTYVDGMRISGYIFTLADHFGIPIYVSTHRMLANKRLMKEILSDSDNSELAAAIGPDLIPKTFDQFIALCDAVKPWSEKTGVSLIPITTHRNNGRVLLDQSIGSQTQDLLLEWPPTRDCRVNDNVWIDRLDRGVEIWSHPAYREGLRLLREIGVRTQPGFMQMRREDSNFTFATQRALMTFVSSQDASSLRAITGGKLEFTAFEVPFPTLDHPHYGDFAMGSLSEGATAASNPFGIVNYASPKKQEIALDFLRFLASYEANATFSEISGFVPAIVGVEPGELAKPFALQLDGYPVGPPLHMNINDVRNLVDTFLFRVVSPQGSVEEFIEEASPALIGQAKESMLAAQRSTLRTAARQDTLFASLYWLQTFDPDSGKEIDRKFDILIDAHDGNETEATMRGPRLEWIMETK